MFPNFILNEFFLCDACHVVLFVHCAEIWIVYNEYMILLQKYFVFKSWLHWICNLELLNL